MAALIRMGFERLRPGGWMESQEPFCDIDCDDGPIPEDHAVKRWFSELCSASLAAGRPLHVTPMIKQWYIDAGFVDVHEKVYKIPMNGWPRVPRLKQIGEMWHRNVEDGMSGLSYALFHRVRGMGMEEIEVSSVPPHVRRRTTDRCVGLACRCKEGLGGPAGARPREVLRCLGPEARERLGCSVGFQLSAVIG
jgi:hypothetical protein